MRLLNTIAEKIDLLSDITGRLVSGLTILMAIVTCIVVAARYAFNLGSVGLQESVMYMHGAVFMLGIAFTLKENAHVRVDVFYERFSRRAKALVDLAGTLFLLMPVAAFIGLSSLDYVALAWSLKESSGQPGGLPGVYLLKTLIPAMAAALALQGLAEIMRNALVLAGRETGDADG